MDVENPMVNDAYWGDFGEDFGEEENEYDWLEQVEEEEEDRLMDYFTWSREQNGYHF